MTRPTPAGRPVRRPPETPALPRLLLLTDRSQARRSLVGVATSAIEAGVRAVVLREKDLGPDERSALADELGPVVHRAGGLLISAGGLLPGVDGMHQGRSAHGRLSGALTGRSCHDESEVRRAEADGVDYVTLSPVFPSRSKPGYGPALGADGLSHLVATTTRPVFALGGVETADAVRACLEAGAHGVAVMGAVMRARRPERVVTELLTAVREVTA